MIPSLVTMPRCPMQGKSHERSGIGLHTIHNGYWSRRGSGIICFSMSLSHSVVVMKRTFEEEEMKKKQKI
jgi:hypothetical protein